MSSEEESNIISNKEEIVSILLNIKETFVDEFSKRSELQIVSQKLQNEREDSNEKKFELGYFWGLKEGIKSSLEIVDEYIEAVIAQTMEELDNLYNNEKGLEDEL